MSDAASSAQCAICHQPVTTVVRIDFPFGTGGWVFALCDTHGLAVTEMVANYYARETIPPERFTSRTEGSEARALYAWFAKADEARTQQRKRNATDE